MDTEHLHQKGIVYLQKLCVDIPERCVGSDGNWASDDSSFVRGHLLLVDGGNTAQ